MRRVSTCAALAVAACVFTSSSSFANLVSDGDFSSPEAGSPFSTLFAGDADGPWIVTGSGCGAYGCAGVDVINDYWSGPPSGGHSVDLDGDAPGGLFQTVKLDSGRKYDLLFYLSANPDGAPTTKTMTVSIGGLDQQLTYTLGGSNSRNNMNYELENFVFTAKGNNILSFVSDDSGYSPFGAVVGGISITAVPEPATWAMLLFGLFGIGAITRYARRSAGYTV